jgi:hypothetical protein
VLTSDKAPKDLEGLQERLLSRFRWGLSADIQVPDYDTRIEILEKKMKADGLDMPKEVVKYVAYNINTNVRELEGALISLLAQSSLNKKEIDVELAKKVLRNRNKLDNCKPWAGLYVVPCSDEDCYRIGLHYHIATENEMETYYAGIRPLEFVSGKASRD